MAEENKFPQDDNPEDNDNNFDASSGANSEPVDEAPKDDLEDRLERLGGEPAPIITPDEFARLQRAGQVHIDSRGRVRTARRSSSNGPEAGVSLRKRRAWY